MVVVFQFMMLDNGKNSYGQGEVKAVDDIEHGINHRKLLPIIDMLHVSTDHKGVRLKFNLIENGFRGKVAKYRDTVNKLSKTSQ
ncbi:hypothetical protein Tco_0827392 [Tanacetum coccineum]